MVAEGRTADVREYVARIRALQWQAMQVRAEELVPCTDCSGSSSAGERRNAAASSSAARGDQEGLRCIGPCRGFGDRFEELPESRMSELGHCCMRAGVEHLFLAALKLPGK